MTGVKLEKISDMDNYLFIEKVLRGRISYIARRYAKKNNKYINTSVIMILKIHQHTLT